MRTHHALGAVALVSTLLATVPASATVPLVEGESVTVDLSGYLRTLAGVQQVTFETGGLLPDTTGTDASVLRLELKSSIGEYVTIELHDRLHWSVVSTATDLGSAAGIGVSPPPPRTVDLSSSLLDEPTMTLTNDVDRLAVRLFFDWADITVGRQAITWGNSLLFTVADLWTSFSPFELDVSEKRGIDAVRMVTSVGERMELEFIVADRGSVDDMSAGARLVAYLDSGDMYVAAAKHWTTIYGFAGFSTDVDAWAIRGEAAWPAWTEDEDGVGLPRATLGVNYFGDGYLLGLELHANGEGAGPDDYMEELVSAERARGERFLLGRAYAGLLASYEATDLLALGLTTMGNLQDPSVVIAPTATYRLGDEAELVAGAYFGLGESPVLTLPIDVRSEFGLFGNLYFVQLAGYL